MRSGPSWRRPTGRGVSGSALARSLLALLALALLSRLPPVQMLRPSLTARQLQQGHSFNASSTLVAAGPGSSHLATVLLTSPAKLNVQVTTVTVLEIVYLAAATTEPPPTASKSSVATADASNLASIATDSYDGLTFVQLGASQSLLKLSDTVERPC